MHTSTAVLLVLTCSKEGVRADVHTLCTLLIILIVVFNSPTQMWHHTRKSDPNVASHVSESIVVAGQRMKDRRRLPRARARAGPRPPAAGSRAPGPSNFVLSSFSCCFEYGRQESYSVLRDYCFATSFLLSFPDTMVINAIVAAAVAAITAGGPPPPAPPLPPAPLGPPGGAAAAGARAGGAAAGGSGPGGGHLPLPPPPPPPALLSLLMAVHLRLLGLPGLRCRLGLLRTHPGMI